MKSDILFYSSIILGESDNQHNWPPTLEDILIENPDLQVGGYYPGPENCEARFSTAIIIPVRNREEHLK